MHSDDYSHLLESFDHRLKSFENWTGNVSPIELALAGFHYIGKEDVVRCFECDIQINKWKPGDVPIHDHLKFSPNCSYAKMMESAKRTAIVNGSLFIHYPYGAKDVFICFNDNDTNWKKMELYKANNIPTLTSLIPNNSTQYKLRLEWTNNKVESTNWNQLYTYYIKENMEKCCCMKMKLVDEHRKGKSLYNFTEEELEYFPLKHLLDKAKPSELLYAWHKLPTEYTQDFNLQTRLPCSYILIDLTGEIRLMGGW
ncbi:unnamed protein product [Psylliodes chrysocephalus]|uniref:Uncharacterized protein n=1 Tax=Psylliodes chrysocephalus TaxID=3402493 RepID=A0A9P0CLL3_9CUCU|nr:unnamed protein product [Psylliodes chrysocephala]